MIDRRDRMATFGARQTMPDHVVDDGFGKIVAPRNPIAATVIPLNNLGTVALVSDHQTQPVAACRTDQRQAPTWHQCRPNDSRCILKQFLGMHRLVVFAKTFGLPCSTVEPIA